jgi:SH3-like domain-containing protein
MSRTTTLSRLIAGAALLLAAGTSHALDFKSVGAAPAILYDAPSTKGSKLFVAPRGMPVEVVLSYGDWVKVRDAGGDLGRIPRPEPETHGRDQNRHGKSPHHGGRKRAAGVYC